MTGCKNKVVLTKKKKKKKKWKILWLWFSVVEGKRSGRVMPERAERRAARGCERTERNGRKKRPKEKGPRDSSKFPSRSMFYLAAASGARVKARDPAAPPG